MGSINQGFNEFLTSNRSGELKGGDRSCGIIWLKSGYMRY